MMSPFELYLLIKLDAIICLMNWFMYPSFILGVICFFVWLVLWVVPFNYNEPDHWGHSPSVEDIADCKAKCKGLRRPVFRIFMISMIVHLPFRIVVSLLPSTKEMSVIYVVPKIINNESIRELPDKLLLFSSDWLEELRPKNVKVEVKDIIERSLPDTSGGKK